MVRSLALLFLFLGLQSCSLVFNRPEKRSISERLASFPEVSITTNKPVAIYWQDNLVPYIEAETDEDAFLALGYVHAHLRLGQMEIFRRVAYGRLSELGGPFAKDVDQLISMLGLSKGIEERFAAMPARTKKVIIAYTAGINAYLEHAKELPIEYKLFQFKKEPYRPEDIIAFSRIAGADVNWLVWLTYLARKETGQITWQRILEHGLSSTVSFQPDNLAGHLLNDFQKSGSNSLVISGQKAGRRGAIISSDPHVGLQLPPLWILQGIKSPSYHVVGFGIPGVPFIGLGRNQRIGWGGTNMRAMSSYFTDLSCAQPSDLKRVKRPINVRYWFDSEVTYRKYKEQVVISDAGLFDFPEEKKFGLYWLGWQNSDEITAFLNAARAQDFKSFRKSFENYAVSGQNMLYADSTGNIGQIAAVKVDPDRPLLEAAVENGCSFKPPQKLFNATNLPAAYNPAAGFLASSNNLPFETPKVGYIFSSNDRIDRLKALIGPTKQFDLSFFHQLHADTYSESSFQLKELLLTLAAEDLEGTNLGSWDGYYEAESKGAAQFMVFLSTYIEEAYEEEDQATLRSYGRSLDILNEDLQFRLNQAAFTEAIQAATNEQRSWGEMHRIRLQHPFGFVPVLGKPFRAANLPAGGSRTTLMKTSHTITDEYHFATFGANARHISFMDDPDENYFILLGGQDGWVKSEAFIDQANLWRAGRYIRIPLDLEKVKTIFTHKTILQKKEP